MPRIYHGEGDQEDCEDLCRECFDADPQSVILLEEGRVEDLPDDMMLQGYCQRCGVALSDEDVAGELEENV